MASSQLFFREGAAIHGCGAIQLFLSKTSLFDNSLFGLENWLAQSEFGQMERKIGQPRNFFRERPTRHRIQSFEWDSFNLFAISFNFQVSHRFPVSAESI